MSLLLGDLRVRVYERARNDDEKKLESESVFDLTRTIEHGFLNLYTYNRL